MGNLHVHVDTFPIPNDPLNSHQTRSKFGKHKDTDNIIFHNDDTQSSLEVNIISDPANGPVLCKKNDNKSPVTLPLSVGVGDKEKYTICQAFKGNDFKYTAKIGTTKLEDPIIIIEKSSASFTVDVVGIAIVAVIGAAIGALVANYFAARRWARPKDRPRRSSRTSYAKQTLVLMDGLVCCRERKARQSRRPPRRGVRVIGP